MNWDRPVHSFTSYPNGEPQTPTRTPISTAFGESTFQTPRIESSFFDPRVTWDTADPYASSPEFLKTPQRFVFNTPSNQSIQPDRQEGSFNQQIRPHLDSTRTAEETDPTKRKRPSKQSLSFGEDAPDTVNSAKCSAASMQTPPPTSTSRRNMGNYEGSNSVQSYADSPRRLSAAGVGNTYLETPSRQVGASPHFLANLQNSPDFFQLSGVDPSASPFFPQHKLFWDQDPDQQAEDAGLPNSFVDPFTPETGGAVFNPGSSVGQNLQVPSLPVIHSSMDLPEFSSDHNFGLGSVTPGGPALFSAPFSTPPRLPISRAEDPSMFLSSPARRFGPPHPDVTQPRKSRQPYHHQTEESKREEQQRARTRMLPGSSPFDAEEDDDDDDYALSSCSARPSLARSMTHTAMTSRSNGRNQSQQSPLGILSSPSGIKKSSKGRSSPTKSLRHHHQRPNSVCLPNRSESVVLFKIDKDRRAKAEIQLIPESSAALANSGSEMAIDSYASAHDSNPAEYSNYPIAYSQSTSFTLPGSALNRPALGRTGSLPRTHSKSQSHSSTISSSTSGRCSPWAESSRGTANRLQGKAKKSTNWANIQRRSSVPSHSGRSLSVSGPIGGTLPEPDEDAGGAQHALRKVLKGRNRNPRQTVTPYASGVPASQPFMGLRSSSPPYGNRLDTSSGDSATSPTTLTDPDIPTPSTDRNINPVNATRCVCKSMGGGHFMVQCESCNHWLHTKCVGLESKHHPGYICVYCAHTPIGGGRIRDPLAVTGHAPSSPLARQSERH